MTQDDNCLYRPEVMDDGDELDHKQLSIRLRAHFEDVTEFWVPIGRDSQDGPEEERVRIMQFWDGCRAVEDRQVVIIVVGVTVHCALASWQGRCLQDPQM